MAWKSSRDKWLQGNIQPKEDKDDVIGWIKSDPIWERADKVTWEPNGSHEGLVYIKDMSRLLAKWDGDVFNISTTGGRWIKRWQVEQLVKAYEQLETLE